MKQSSCLVWDYPDQHAPLKNKSCSCWLCFSEDGNQKWSPSAEACICYDPSLLDAVDQTLPNKLLRCCSNATLMKIGDDKTTIVSAAVSTSTLHIHLEQNIPFSYLFRLVQDLAATTQRSPGLVLGNGPTLKVSRHKCQSCKGYWRTLTRSWMMADTVAESPRTPLDLWTSLTPKRLCIVKRHAMETSESALGEWSGRRTGLNQRVSILNLLNSSLGPATVALLKSTMSRAASVLPCPRSRGRFSSPI